MADPRSTTNRNGIDPRVATYAVDASTITYSATVANGSAGVGLAVNLASSGVVRLVSDAEPVLGKLLSVESDGFCSVQTGGHVTLPGGSSATLTAGSKIVGALGASSAKGYIRSVAAATLAEVAVADHSIQDSSTATAVDVLLR